MAGAGIFVLGLIVIFAWLYIPLVDFILGFWGLLIGFGCVFIGIILMAVGRRSQDTTIINVYGADQDE